MRDGHAAILVVDDEKTLRDIIGRALAKMGHECVVAENGVDALAVAGQRAFDLVVTDLKMPKMDGISLIAALRERQPDLPIIIMTGYADIESARKALRLRVSDYLVKPFESLAEVQAAAQRAIDTHTSRLGADSLVDELDRRAHEFKERERDLTQSLEQAKTELRSLTTQLKKSEAVATRQVEQIETMIDNVSNGILVTDTRGTVLSLNQELRRQLQAPRLHGSGLSVDRLPGDAALRDAMVQSRNAPHLDSDTPVVAESTDATGDVAAYEVRSARVVGADGEAVGIVTTVRKARARPAVVS